MRHFFLIISSETIDLAEILRYIGSIHESHNPVYDDDGLLIEIRAVEWVLGQIQDLMIKSKIRKDRKNRELE